MFTTTDIEIVVERLKALASVSRLQILDCIQKGICTPIDVAKAVKLEPTTVAQHLKILLAAGIAEKIPSLAEGERPTVYYRIRENAKDELLDLIRNIFKMI